MTSTAPSTPVKPESRVTRGRKHELEPRKPPFLLPFILLSLLAFVIVNALSYDEVVENDPDGNPVLTPARQEEIDRRQRKNREEAEQYVLRARTAGYRDCYLCPEGKIWLEVGEIAKIGSSTDGQKRYSSAYYRKHDVYYQMEYKGTLTIAKNKELERLGTYPLLPENQKRKTKQMFPPLNAKLD